MHLPGDMRARHSCGAKKMLMIIVVVMPKVEPK